MTEEEKDIKLSRLERENVSLKAENNKYKENGVAKLYYALSRKAWEMADLMNDTDLKTIEMDDPKSKKFDRLKVIWNDASSIAVAVKSLGEAAGITGDEKKDTAAKNVLEFAEVRK